MIVLIVLATIGLLLIIGQLTKPKPEPTGMILFYGDTCPHCKIVEQYINDNNIKAKLQFTELEVFNNKANSALMLKKAKACQLDTTKGMGVPFFFDGQNCLLGDQDIINFFKTK